MQAVPVQTPSVVPEQNRNPEQLQRLGQSMDQAGGTAFRLGQTIGDRVQEQMDDANTKSAENTFLQSAQSILNDPSKGYFRQLGKNAVDQYQPTQEALVKAGNDAQSGLTNSIQKQMFKQVLQQHLLSFGKQMADYNHGQSAAYAATESKARAQSYSLLALGAMDSRSQTDADGNRTGDFAKYTFQMDSEVLKTAQIAGFAPDSPQAQAMLREQHTELNHAMIAKMLDNHDAKGAKAWFDQESAAGNIDLRNSEQLGSAIKSEMDHQDVEDGIQKYSTQALTPEVKRDTFMAVDNPKGLVEKGNLPIWNRPIVKNDDGSVSTEYSTSFNQDGKEVLVPTVVNGKFLTPDGKKPEEGSAAEKTMFKAAWDHYLKTGENLGKFDNPDDADAYAQQLHSRSPAKQGPPQTDILPVPGSSINVTSGLGAQRSGGRSHDGIDIAVPVGTNVMAPSAGKVTKVWNDDKFGGGLSMEMQLNDGRIVGFAHLSATSVKVGDDVQQGAQVALSGKTGNATGPVLHYMMKDANGQYIDPRQASQPQPNMDGFADPNALEKAVQAAQNGPEAPQIKKQIIAGLEAQHSHYRAIENQKYDELTQAARDAFFASGGNYNAIPASIRLQLKPEDTFRFQQGLPKKDNVDAQADFILNPNNQNVAWVQAHRMDFSDGTYLSYLSHATAVQNSSGKELGATMDNTQMDDVLIQNNLQNLTQPKDDTDKATAIALKTRIIDIIDNQQQQLGRSMTRDEKRKVMQQTIMDQVFTPGWVFKGDPHINSLLSPEDQKIATVYVNGKSVKVAEIPSTFRQSATTSLMRTNQPVTEQNIAALWLASGKAAK